MTKKKHGAFVFAALCVLWTAVIFGFSLKSGETSSSESYAVAGLLSWIMGRLSVTVPPSVHVVRKLAHFFEYFVLGGLAYAAFHSSGARRGCSLSFGYAVLVALADEFICQNISEGRGACLSDVLLDSAGALLGVFGAAVLAYFIFWNTKRKKGNKISKNA